MKIMKTIRGYLTLWFLKKKWLDKSRIPIHLV
jgi:hypothetical protein